MDPERGVAAFDFDGTLVKGDSFPRFLAHLLGRWRFALLLVMAFPAMLSSYRLSGRDGAKSALLSRTLAGLSVDAARAAADEFARTLAARIRPVMAEVMAWHERQGHRRILVSASLALYLEPFGHLKGFDEVIATRLEVGCDGRLTGRMDGPNVRAEQKAIRLAAALSCDQVEIWAYGDSVGDREMLAMADHPVWAGRRLRRLP
jgi:phosphatidylglycerophosphatase C